MNKKILLFLMILLCSSKEIFADFAFGFNAYTNWRHQQKNDFKNFQWGLGGTLAFGDMYGRPLILEIAGNSYSSTSAQVKVNLDWHVLPVNLGDMAQIFFGLGAGSTFNFNPSKVFAAHDNFEWTKEITSIVYGRIPVGLKIFLSSVEIFLGVTPMVGWNVKEYAFYWSIEGETGLRIWF